ncbi:uncharacterized protein EDB93DRAFT_1094054, partial [Suillus bovinus]|uniref:uncharacterized protein n=1 Tax=Suillus bovinus TaxID=48563 RepID=UPI001B86BDD6
LCQPTSKEAMKRQFDHDILFCIRTFPIVAEYLPIQLQINDELLLRRIELDNSLLTNSITSICWIKPPQRRSLEQCKAFALIYIADPHSANHHASWNCCCP